MEDSALYQQFYIWLAVVVVIVLAAAVLLILVLFAARRILRLATAALGLVEQIRANTNSIWGLQQTNEVACDLSLIHI